MKRENIIIMILTIVIAVMDFTGMPSVFFVNIKIKDINPFYFTMMVNFALSGILAFSVLKIFCPKWKLGFKRQGLTSDIKKYGIIGIVVAIIGFTACYVGNRPFDLRPSIQNVLIGGVVCNIGVAIIEELYVRGLLLNLIERLFVKSKNCTFIAITLSSIIFGFGHIFGVLNQSPFVIISKVLFTIGMALFFGMIYKKTNNIWLPIIVHFLINICALPGYYSSTNGYVNLTLYILLPTYFILGVYSLLSMRKKVTD